MGYCCNGELAATCRVNILDTELNVIFRLQEYNNLVIDSIEVIATNVSIVY